MLLDYHHQHGAGGPRAVWRSIYPTGRCCVLTAVVFLSRYPPSPDTPLLSGLGYHLASATILSVFRAPARFHNLDSMRFGAIVILTLLDMVIRPRYAKATGPLPNGCRFIVMLL
jgi:hypothetical protein